MWQPQESEREHRSCCLQFDPGYGRSRQILDAHWISKTNDMVIDRRWAERNLGFDPIATLAPNSTFSFRPAATSSDVDDLQREIIDFDSESVEGREFLAFHDVHWAFTIHRHSLA